MRFTLATLVFLLIYTSLVGCEDANKNGSDSVIIDESNHGNNSSCVHDYHPPTKGKIVIGEHDSLATLVQNSSIMNKDMGAMFDADQTSYSSIGENVEVIFNSEFGTIKLPQNLIVEFSYTEKFSVESDRDRILDERYISGFTARALPLYYNIDCLTPDIERLEREILSLGFKPVTLRSQFTLNEIKEKFFEESSDRLRDYRFASWRRGNMGICLSIVQAEMRESKASKSRTHKFLYNLVFDTTYIPDVLYWSEVK